MASIVLNPLVHLLVYFSSPGPDIIVCDEGHVLRSSSSNLSAIVNQVKTRCRMVLTGTPLQNNLLECTSIDATPPTCAHTHTHIA